MSLKREIYTPQELAAELRIGKRMILKEIAAGRLKAAKLSRNVIRIWATDVIAWLEGRLGGSSDSDLSTDLGW